MKESPRWASLRWDVGRKTPPRKALSWDMRHEQNLAKQSSGGEACSRQNTCKGHEVEMIMELKGCCRTRGWGEQGSRRGGWPFRTYLVGHVSILDLSNEVDWEKGQAGSQRN